ncbi:MAG TPA: hypothetical protein VLT81_18720, partial [Chondromyces sp.]|nr:hypothetical protein [Chondromyces sp.]
MKNRTLVMVSAVLLALAGPGVGIPMSEETGFEAVVDGVLVAADPATGDNRVWIAVGDDSLAVDAQDAVMPTQAQPRYALATGADRAPAPPEAAVLWPASRAPGEAPSGRVTVVVPPGFSLASGGREVVILDLGRAASRGDAVIWLPRERVLVTGAVCSRGRVAATAESDTQAWLRVLAELQDLEPAVVVPGRGPAGGPELLQDQIDRVSELRGAVEQGLLAGRSAAAAAESLEAPWFAAWRKADPGGASAAFRAVFDEVGGLRTPWQLIEDRGLSEGPSPTAADPGWSK